MTNHHTTGRNRAVRGGGDDRARLAGGVLLGAVASGALAVGALSGAGAANATCASISAGLGCTSTVTSVAVGLGDNTTASALGLNNSAIAVCRLSNATNLGGNGNTITTTPDGTGIVAFWTWP
jgi:hypothetical protein